MSVYKITEKMYRARRNTAEKQYRTILKYIEKYNLSEIDVFGRSYRVEFPSSYEYESRKNNLNFRLDICQETLSLLEENGFSITQYKTASGYLYYRVSIPDNIPIKKTETKPSSFASILYLIGVVFLSTVLSTIVWLTSGNFLVLFISLFGYLFLNSPYIYMFYSRLQEIKTSSELEDKKLRIEELKEKEHEWDKLIEEYDSEKLDNVATGDKNGKQE